MMIVHAVIFDMDGVLIDSEPIWRIVIGEVFSEIGVVVSEEELKATTGLRFDHAMARWHERHRWTEPTVQEVCKRIVTRLAERLRQTGKAAPGALECVQLLQAHGLKLGVASSSAYLLIDAVLDATGLRSYFDVYHSAESETQGKPAPDVYLGAARRLGVAPQHCLAIEDSSRGLAAAQAAGMHSVYLLGTEPPGGQPTAVISSLLELDLALLNLVDAAPR